MMDLKIFEEGFGEVQWQQELTPDLMQYDKQFVESIVFKGRLSKGLLQGYKGEGFTAWHSRYWMAGPATMRAIGEEPFLEIRFAIRRKISGLWETISEPELDQYFFTMSFATHVNALSTFNEEGLYETFDLHVELDMLVAEFGTDYRKLEAFLDNVANNKTGNIDKRHFPCSREMLETLSAILRSGYTEPTHSIILNMRVRELIAMALEVIESPEHVLPKGIQPGDEEKIYAAKQMILLALPAYPGNKSICRELQLNSTKLRIGFKHFIGMAPSKFYMQQKLFMARDMILKGDKTIDEISLEIGHRWAQDFTEVFRRHLGCTPTEFAEKAGVTLPKRSKLLYKKGKGDNRIR